MNRLVFYYPRHNRCSVNALAAALEADPVPGLEAVFPGTPAEMAAELKGAGKETAAAISYFTCQKREAAALAARLRALAPEAVLLAGGPHPSSAPLEALAAGFDYALTGEGEEALPRLLRALAAGRPPESPVIAGAPADLGRWPAFSGKYGLFGPIEITRGCPFACTYCQTSYIFGGRPRHRPLPMILEAMGQMLGRGLKDIRFITPDVFAYGSKDGRAMNLPALEAFIREAGEYAAARGGRIYVGSFPSEARPEHVTPEALALVKRYAHNRRLIIGAQAASPRSLKALRRGHGPAEVYRAAELCREYRISPYFDFILGLPGETPADEDATMEMIERLSALGSMIHLHSFMPLPGTPLQDAPPAAIGRRMERFIMKMESRGKAFGKWQAQRRIGAG